MQASKPARSAGFTRFDNIIGDASEALKLTASELNVIRGLLRYSWAGSLLIKATQAALRFVTRMSTRTIARVLASLEAKNFLRVAQRRDNVRLFDLSPLFEACQKLAPKNPFATREQIELTEDDRIRLDVLTRQNVYTPPEILSEPSCQIDQAGNPHTRKNAGPRGALKECKRVEKEYTNSPSTTDMSCRVIPFPSAQPKEIKMPAPKPRSMNEVLEQAQKDIAKNRVPKRIRKKRAAAAAETSTQREYRGGWTSAPKWYRDGLRRLLGRQPEQYTAKDLETVFVSAWLDAFPNTPPSKFSTKELKLAKNLLQDYGGKTARTLVEKVVADWADFSGRYNLNGAPSMSIIGSSFKKSFLKDIFEGATDNKNRRPQYNQTPSELDHLASMF